MRILITLAAVSFGAAALAQVPFTSEISRMTIEYGPGAAVCDYAIYDNTVNGTGYYFPTDMLPADDLHMIDVGNPVQGFMFGYYDPAGNTAVSFVDVFFWNNDPNDGTGDPMLAAFQVGGLPGDGAWIVTVCLPEAFWFNTGRDVWMGVDFYTSDSPEAGLLIYDPPVIGTSHDMFWDARQPFGAFYWFGGDPHANFSLGVLVPEPGALVAVGAGLIGLLALRRRK